MKVKVYVANGRVCAEKTFNTTYDAYKYANEQSKLPCNKAVAIEDCFENIKILKGVKGDIW